MTLATLHHGAQSMERKRLCALACMPIVRVPITASHDHGIPEGADVLEVEFQAVQDQYGRVLSIKVQFKKLELGFRCHGCYESPRRTARLAKYKNHPSNLWNLARRRMGQMKIGVFWKKIGKMHVVYCRRRKTKVSSQREHGMTCVCLLWNIFQRKRTADSEGS